MQIGRWHNFYVRLVESLTFRLDWSKALMIDYRPIGVNQLASINRYLASTNWHRQLALTNRHRPNRHRPNCCRPIGVNQLASAKPSSAKLRRPSGAASYSVVKSCLDEIHYHCSFFITNVSHGKCFTSKKTTSIGP